MGKIESQKKMGKKGKKAIGRLSLSFEKIELLS